MCIHISRRYSCWDTTPRPGVPPRTPPGHHCDYLAKCANPLTHMCLNMNALPWVQEKYGVPCPNCDQSCIHPDAQPTYVESADDDQMEARPEAQEAAKEYARVLCFFLNIVFRNDEDMDAHNLIDKFAACVVEIACKFDPQHFSLNNCDCQEANTHPELRNVAAGMKYVPAFDLLNNREHGLEVSWNGTLHEFQQEYALASMSDFEKFCRLSHMHSFNGMLGGTTVLPYWRPSPQQDGERKAVIQQLEAMASATINEQWREEAVWHEAYRQGNEAWPAMYGHMPAKNALKQRLRVLYIVARFLAADSGLSLGRRVSIYSFFLRGLEPMTENLKKLFPDPVLQDAMIRLMEGERWMIQRDESAPARYYGSLWADGQRFQFLDAQLSLNQRLRINLEHSRVQIAKMSIQYELTADDFLSLPPPGTQPGRDQGCFMCNAPMTHGPGLPPQVSLPEGDGRQHRAVLLTCDGRHLVGRGCWMNYGRHKADLDADALDCLLCQQNLGILPVKTGTVEDISFRTMHEIRRGSIDGISEMDWQVGLGLGRLNMWSNGLE